MRAVLSLAIVAMLVSPSATAQATEDDRLVAEVAGIHETLKRLVALMEAAEKRGAAELLLHRIEVMERRTAPLQGRLSEAESDVHGIETEIERLQTMGREVETSLDEAIRAGDADQQQEAEEFQSHLRRELKQLEQRLETAIQRRRRAEDDLATARETIEILDERLLEAIDER